MVSISDEFFCILDECCISRKNWVDNIPPCVDCDYCISQMSIEINSIS